MPRACVLRYGSRMSQSQDTPPDLDHLVRELAGLPESKRHAVFAAAERAARQRQRDDVSAKNDHLTSSACYCMPRFSSAATSLSGIAVTSARSGMRLSPG